MDEKAFQKVLKKVRDSASRDELANAVLSGLQLTLPRPENGQLLADLQTKAANIIKNITAGDAKTQSAEIRQATIRCIVLLETAQQKGAGSSTPSKSWPKIILVSVVAATAFLYLILLASRYL